MKSRVLAASLALAAFVATSPVSRADDQDAVQDVLESVAPTPLAAVPNFTPIAKGTRTLYIFNGARHFDLTSAVGALTATHCTHLGQLPTGTTSVPILIEFYGVSGTVLGSATSSIDGANSSRTVCTGINATSRKVGCNPGMGLTGTFPLSGFIRVVVPTKNASRILCSAEIASGVDGGAANIVDRLVGVRKGGALVIPPDSFIP